MKSINIKLSFTINDLLSYFDLLGTQDLQRVADKISYLLAKKNSPNQKDQEKELLAIINQRLPKTFLDRFQQLKSNIQSENLTKMEWLEMAAYTEEIEEFDTKKINALNQLAKLKKVPFQQLVIQLKAFPRPNE